MRNKKRIKLIVIVALLGAVAIGFLATSLKNHSFSKRIPVVRDVPNLSEPVKNQLQDAYHIARKKPNADNIGELGMIFHSSANYDEAARCYLLAIEKSERDWRWHFYLAYLYRELAQTEKAINYFNQVLVLNPNNNLAWYYLGGLYRNVGDDEYAEHVYSKLKHLNELTPVKGSLRKDKFPLNIYALFQIAKIHADAGDYNAATKVLLELIAQNDRFGPAFRLLGNIHKMSGEHDHGDYYLVRSNDLLAFTEPVDVMTDKLALMSRSDLYLMKKIDEAISIGYKDWALKLVEQGMKYLSTNKNMLSKAVNVYLLNDRREEANKLQVQHLQAFSDNHVELFDVGMSFFKKEMHEQAQAYFKQLLVLKPDDIDAYKYLSFCYYSMGNETEAHKILNRAAEHFLNQPDQLADVIFMFLQFDNNNKAAYYLKELERIQGADSKLHKIYALIAEKEGNLEKSIYWYELSFDANPQDDETINKLGNILLHLKKWDEAIRFYEKVYELYPNNPEYLGILGDLLVNCPDISLRNYNEGIRYCIRAYSHKSSSPALVMSSGKNLALALASLGDLDSAMKSIKSTLDLAKEFNAPEKTMQELAHVYRIIQEY